ncbi:regulator of protease activity HflC (stomatin/prohibitin superfamily)/membrane protein implicated in regulation of membrane protease activity [Bradyrhizobium sp. LB7.1]
MVGIYGLIFEFMSPGAVAPGVVGSICLLLGLYALNLLPINYAGLGLMLVGIALLAIEAFNPTVVIGLGGVVAFVLGAIMLVRVEAPGYRLSWSVIAVVAAMFTGFVLIVLGALRRARRGPPRVGAQAMRGLAAEVLDWNEKEGHVFTHGERWQARGTDTFKPGERVGVGEVGGGRQYRRPDAGGPASGRCERGRSTLMFEYSIYAVLALIVIMFLTQAVRILREYERGVIFTLGRFTGVKGPGLIILIPVVQQLVKVDLRVMVQVVPPQDVISRDNVSVKVNAVLYFRIVDPERAIIKVGDYMAATSQLAQTTLRSVLGKHELDEMLAERDRLSADIQEILDKQTDVWGIKVTGIEIKDVDLNETMVRAIAKQAEAERLRRAKVINAMGEQQAAEKLVEAGRILAQEPQAMQLRYFAALHDIAGERSSTVVFPLPIGLLDHLMPRRENP